MQDFPETTYLTQVFRLVSDARLDFGFIEGFGLGAFLLAFEAVVLIRSQTFNRIKPISLFKALAKVWRSPKPRI